MFKFLGKKKKDESKVFLNEQKEYIFKVMQTAKDSKTKEPKFANRTLKINEEGLTVISDDQQSTAFIPFNVIRTFTVHPATIDEWKIHFLADPATRKFQMFTFVTPEAREIQNIVQMLIQMILRDREFESESSSNYFY
eukprot:TRINITY_DN1306_c0_g1_i1.p1 TRINITY_DN1306_c0_g1~~TRINITY_DN1306_c0_g1_i1.p1  ORF type:complete len:138 (-),score=34.22 TRINITY_DN1306_c0_g1_i1:114-527(-)